MFCPGTANLPNGKVLITGGSSTTKSTVYGHNYGTNSGAFTKAREMNTPRGYHSMVTLGDGRVFALGGSWSGGIGNKNAEMWAETSGWTPYPGITAAGTVQRGSPDPEGVYRSDNHAWLFSASNGKVFHAGPGQQMHWIDVNGIGTVANAGGRAWHGYAMNGNAVMYDVDKVLTCGGAISYARSHQSSNMSFKINIAGGRSVVSGSGFMRKRRAFHNSVVLPNGEVVAVGGSTRSRIFEDSRAVKEAEIWSPANGGSWRLGAAMSVPRTYHSVAILMRDGRVWVSGGGLCGNCNGNPGLNHANAEIYTPPYLYKPNSNQLATRPVINSINNRFTSHGAAITVNTNSTIKQFVLMRLSSVTHSVNNEQRRVPLNIISSRGNSYSVRIPWNRNVAPPGDYFLFAINNSGVPSVALSIRVGAEAVAATIPNGDYYIESIARPSNTRQNLVLNANDAVLRPINAVANNQKIWRIRHVGGNAFTIQHVASRRYLEVPFARTGNGSNVATYTSGAGDHQRWVITKVGGNFYFRPVHHKRIALDQGNGTNQTAKVWPFSTGNANQRFKLIGANGTPTPRFIETSSSISFNAKPTNEKTTELDWTFNLEKKVARYVVQYSNEDNEDFADLEVISAKDGSTDEVYTYTHKNPISGLNFYQIRIEFVDGATEYLPFRQVAFAKEEVPLNIFPNPSKGELFIDLANYMDEEVSYVIVNPQGISVSEGIIEQGHSEKERLDLSQLENGNYFIYLKPAMHDEIAKQFILMK